MCLVKDQCHTLRRPIEAATSKKQRGVSESLAKTLKVDVPPHLSPPKNAATSNHSNKSERVLASSPFISLPNSCPSIESIVKCIDIPLEQESACLFIRAQYVACRSSGEHAECKYK